MKKTIISIIGIAVMLLAITACRPSYVVVPFPGGNTSTVPSGTPVSTGDELLAALKDGGAVYLTQNIQLSADDFANIPANSVIDGGTDKKTITILEESASGTGVLDLAANNMIMRNVVLDFTQGQGGASLLAATRAAGDTFAILIGSGNGEIDNAPSGITLSGVTIKTGENIAGINVHTARNVTLENITIEDKCQKAPISISSSENVVIDNIIANGSSWYGEDNVIQVNGVGGGPNHKASTITFKNTGNIDRVWVEAVENVYDQTAGITDADFEEDGQTTVAGLSWPVRFSNQPSKGTKGWTYYANDIEANTFTLNNDDKITAVQAEADIRAMLDVLMATDGVNAKYTTIQLGQNISLAAQLDITIPVTIDGANNVISLETVPAEATQGEKSAIMIKSPDVTLRNLTVSGPDTKSGSVASSWDQGEYAIKAYGEIGANGQLKNIVLEDITIQKANAGMLVRGADVTLKGGIVLNTLGFGGFGVDSDSKDYDCDLTVAESCNVSGNLNGVPAIWTEHVMNDESNPNEKVTVYGKGLADPVKASTKEQTWFNLVEKN